MLVGGNDASGVVRWVVDDVGVAGPLATVAMYPRGVVSGAGKSTDTVRECPRERRQERGGLHESGSLLTTSFRTSPCTATYFVSAVAKVAVTFLDAVEVGRYAE